MSPTSLAADLPPPPLPLESLDAPDPVALVPSWPALESLMARWRRAPLAPTLLPPVPRSRTAAVFASLESVATADVLALYEMLGGTTLPNDEHWTLWPLEQVAGQGYSPRGVEFADHLPSGWSYRLRPVSAAHSAVYVDRHAGQPTALVAGSLQEFFARYRADAADLLDPDAAAVRRRR